MLTKHQVGPTFEANRREPATRKSIALGEQQRAGSRPVQRRVGPLLQNSWMSENNTLAALILAVRQRSGELRLDHFSEKFRDLLTVTSELLRSSLEHAEAIYLLLTHGQVEATAALERAAWEIWKELEFLVTREDADLDASRSRIHAALDVHELATKASGEAPPGMLERVAAIISEYERTHTDLVREMRELRKKQKSLHWSGATRTGIYAPDDASTTVYKLLSWESHPIAVGVRDVEISSSGTEAAVTFRPIENRDVLGERVAWAVGHSLLFSWNDYAKVWGFKEIQSPWPH